MPGRTRQPSRFVLPLGPDHAFALLVGLLVATFLMGGGSRADIASLAYLRPLACLAAALGIVGLRREHWRAYRAPFVLLGALALLIAVQLVPLPPSLWAELPFRQTIRELDLALGLGGQWRPISLSPAKTANSLASLVVPFAVLVLYCQLDAERQRQALVAIVALAVTSALVGILQLLAGADSGLYLYEVTNRGDAVGLFANRNHQSVFLAAAMLVSLHLATARAAPARDAFAIVCFAAALLLLAAVVGNVSRAGLLSAGVALVLAPLVATGRGLRRGTRWLAAALFALAALGVFLLFAMSQRSPALARLLVDGQTEEIRARILPVLVEMAAGYQPWGAGFGAFEYAYRMHEPAELLVPRYFNNAHNDWLQFAIEGGAGALVLLAAGVTLVAARAGALAFARGARDDPWRARGWLGFSVLFIFGFASLFDYPLRVPSIMAVAIMVFASLTNIVSRDNRGESCD